MKRGNQETYDLLLDRFGARTKSPGTSVAYLMNKGYSRGQAQTAVYRYLRKGGAEKARTRRTQDEWNEILSRLDPERKRPRQEILEELMDRYGASYPQANSAIYFSGR